MAQMVTSVIFMLVILTTLSCVHNNYYATLQSLFDNNPLARAEGEWSRHKLCLSRSLDREEVQHNICSHFH